MKRIDTSTRAVNINGTNKDGFTDGNPNIGAAATALNATWFNNIQEELCTIIESAGVTLDAANPQQVNQVLSTKLATKFGSVTWVPASPTPLNANTIQAPGLYGCASGATNTPTTAGFLWHGAATDTTQNGCQFWVSASTFTAAVPELYMRYRLGVSWYGWVRMWSSANTPSSTFTTAVTNRIGYQQLPNGLILQWGVWPNPYASITSPITPGVDAYTYLQAYSISFPTVFPNACFNVTGAAVTDNTGLSNRDSWMWISGFTAASYNVSYIEGTAGLGQQMRLSWMAIGY